MPEHDKYVGYYVWSSYFKDLLRIVKVFTDDTFEFIQFSTGERATSHTKLQHFINHNLIFKKGLA